MNPPIDTRHNAERWLRREYGKVNFYLTQFRTGNANTAGTRERRRGTRFLRM